MSPSTAIMTNRSAPTLPGPPGLPTAIGPVVTTNKQVLLSGQGVDFGGAFFDEASETPLTSGTLSFRDDGVTIEPRLTGSMHLYQALGVTARMQMRYFNAAGNTLATKVSSSHTATSADHERIDIDMNPFDDPTIHRVNVSTTVEAGGNWYTVTARNYYLFDLGSAVESVQLNGVDIDFGGWGFDGTSPTSAGELAWNIGNGTIRPHLTGYLHLNEARGVTARMQLDYLDRQGNMLSRNVGGSVEAPTSGHHRWSVDLNPFESPAIYQVRVYTTLETMNGWGVVTSQLYTI